MGGAQPGGCIRDGHFNVMLLISLPSVMESAAGPSYATIYTY